MIELTVLEDIFQTSMKKQNPPNDNFIYIAIIKAWQFRKYDQQKSGEDESIRFQFSSMENNFL